MQMLLAAVNSSSDSPLTSPTSLMQLLFLFVSACDIF